MPYILLKMCGIFARTDRKPTIDYTIPSLSATELPPFAMSLTTSFTNQFLIAMPNLADPNFFHSVTYICEHNDQGALGIVINRETELTLGEVLDHIEISIDETNIANTPIYLGGPVQPERGFVIHRPPGQWDSMMRVTDNIAVATSRDILTSIASGHGPDDLFIALGYAGWGPGQLEQEMSQNAWLSSPADEAIIFNTPTDKRWQSAASLVGVDLQLLSPDAGHA